MNSQFPIYTIDWRENSISVAGPQADNDWDAVFRVIVEHKLSTLKAGDISDSALERLPDVASITNLQMAGAERVTDHGLSQLTRMPQLTDVKMGGRNSPITDSGFEALSHLPELRRVQASWTPGISDAAIAHLTGCESLEDVNLLGTRTGDGALRALVDKRHLRRFQSGSGVTDVGLTLLDRFPVFKTWQGGEIRYGLMNADTGPNYLLIDGPFTDSGLSKLVGLHGLFGLSLFWHSPHFTSAGLAVLKKLPRLGFLGCQGEHCDDEAMRHIAAIPGLKMLMAQGAVASDEGFEALSRSQSIEYLWGRECPHFTGRGFAALSAMQSLRGIAISCKKVDDVALSALANFPALRKLMPMDFEDDQFQHVSRCHKLEALWCMYCHNTGDRATEHVRHLPGLKTYYAGGTKISDRSLRMLGQMDSLENLEFWNCPGLTDAGVAQVAGLPRLREITLSGLPNVTPRIAAMFPAQVRVKYSE